MNVARAEAGPGRWWLGWEWFTTASAVVDWLCAAALAMTEQLSPESGHVVGRWVAGVGPAAVLGSLTVFRACGFRSQ